MRERRSVDAAAHHDLDALRGGRHPSGLLENGNHPVLASGAPGIVIVHVRLGVADKRGIVVQLPGDHHVDLLLIQAESVLDGVAAGDDGVLLPLPAVDVAASFVTEAMRFVDQSL